MNISSINKLLLFNYLKIWNKNSKFESILNIFSLLIVSLSIASIIIITSINNGFKNNVISIMEDIGGYERIYKNDYSYLDLSDYTKINNIIADDDVRLSKIISKQCIIINQNISDSGADYDLNSISELIDIIKENH